jgi:hypothetical protein
MYEPRLGPGYDKKVHIDIVLPIMILMLLLFS